MARQTDPAIAPGASVTCASKIWFSTAATLDDEMFHVFHVHRCTGSSLCAGMAHKSALPLLTPTSIPALASSYRLIHVLTPSIDQIEAVATSPPDLQQFTDSILEGLRVLEAWGFTYQINLVGYKVRKDGGPDGRGVGSYFRNVAELILFGVRRSMRTLAPGEPR